MKKLFFIRNLMSVIILLLCLKGKAEIIQNSQINTFVEISDSDVFSLLAIPKSIGKLRLIDFSGIEEGNYLFTTKDLDPNDGENNLQVAFNNKFQLDTTLSNINHVGFIKHKNFVIYPEKTFSSNIQVLSNTITKKKIVLSSSIFTKDILTIDSNTVIIFSSKGIGIVKTLFDGDNYLIDSFCFKIIRNGVTIFQNHKSYGKEDKYLGCFMGDGFFGFVMDSIADTKIIYTYLFKDKSITRTSVKAKNIYTNKGDNILITTDNGIFKKLYFKTLTRNFIEHTLPEVKSINKIKILSFDYYSDTLFILGQKQIKIKSQTYNVMTLYKVSSSVKEMKLYTNPRNCSKFNKLIIEKDFLYLVAMHDNNGCDEFLYTADKKNYPCWESIVAENENSFAILKVSLIHHKQKMEINSYTIDFERISKVMGNNFIPVSFGKGLKLYAAYYKPNKFCPELYAIKIGEMTYYFDSSKKLIWNEFNLRKKLKDKDINSAIKFCLNNFKINSTYLNLYVNL